MTNTQQDWSGGPWDHLAGPWQDIRRRAASAASAASAGVGIPRDDVRIGDAERHEMTETLSRHFAEGRLDESEFQERVDRAMSAKTRGDLRGLLSDLPPVGAGAAPAAKVPQPGFHRRHRIARSIVLVTVAILVVGALLTPLYPWHGWWLIVLVVALVFARRGSRWHRHGADGGHHHGGPGHTHDHGTGTYGAPPPYA